MKGQMMMKEATDVIPQRIFLDLASFFISSLHQHLSTGTLIHSKFIFSFCVLLLFHELVRTCGEKC